MKSDGLTDLCQSCKYADWEDGELWGCTHVVMAECEDCKECAPHKAYRENKYGDTIECCMYEEAINDQDNYS